MIRRAFRRGLTLGLLGGAIATLVRTVQARRVAQPAPAAAPSWDPMPDATPVVVPAVNLLQEAPAKKAAARKATKKTESTPAAPWVDPTDGECPGTHPIKGKLASKIFHVPGGFNYPRTKPDRCYIDAPAAEADGLRPSKR